MWHQCPKSTISHPIIDDLPIPHPTIHRWYPFLLLTSTFHLVKDTLDAFANATGLATNYHKTSFPPINVPPSFVDRWSHGEHSSCSGWLLSVGLPWAPPYRRTRSFSLTATLTFLVVTNTLLDHVPLYSIALGGLLSPPFLSSPPLHYIVAIKLPKGVINAIDRRCRAFFWIREDTCHEY
jgi:hypothetical protein